MVESARKSIFNVPYEIVIVDGGSTDGTMEWCAQQSDIKFIEHGKLLGAVKAFNDGAKAARGKYVVLANDDIIFNDESLLSAYAFMEDNPTVGIGCFYQDRGKREWHVEGMSAVKPDGSSGWTYYGQVCIVPKELGDQVGWWGDYLRTYGGDNEISCNILELGYQILPVPCACINDLIPMDALRTINMQQLLDHPDSDLWKAKWTRGNKLGPNLPTSWKSREFTRDLRILYAPIFEKGFDIQKTSKCGLRKALQKIATVVEVDYVHTSMDYVHDVALSFRPDIFLLQIHNPEHADTIQAIRREFPDAVLVNWNGDYHPEILLLSSYIKYLEMFDLVGLVTTSVDKYYITSHVDYFYWQIGYESSKAEPWSQTPHYDVLFMGNAYTKERHEFGKFLRGLPYHVGLYGNWAKELKPNGYTLYDFDEGERLYKACKIAVSDSQWPHATGFVSNRLFQVMSAGAFMLQQEFDGMEELLGLKDGVHLVVWKSFEDLQDKIHYYLKNPELREFIAKAGQTYVLKHHSFDVRVKELLNELKRRGRDYTSVYKQR
jgi:glycosyltransferase involved in cell wall biosynthesis